MLEQVSDGAPRARPRAGTRNHHYYLGPRQKAAGLSILDLAERISRTNYRIVESLPTLRIGPQGRRHDFHAGSPGSSPSLAAYRREYLGTRRWTAVSFTTPNKGPVDTEAG